jgi:hypothetical protein
MTRVLIPAARLLFAAAALCGASATAMPDDYVAAVQADVAEFTNGQFSAPADSDWLGAGAAGAADDGSASLASFHDFLKQRFPGTHILFKGLQPAQQTEVWEDYVKTGDLGGIRTNIFAMRSGRRLQASGPAINNLPQD